jgi:hypothetical protein
MTQLSKTAFLSKYATIFANNSTREISEEDVRDFRQDVSDSFLNIPDQEYNGIKGIATGVSTQASLSNILTVNLSATAKIHVLFRDIADGDSLKVYELVAGTDANSPPEVVRPIDYATTTNEKVWKLAVSGSVLTDGNGTTANGSAVDLGGNVGTAVLLLNEDPGAFVLTNTGTDSTVAISMEKGGEEAALRLIGTNLLTSEAFRLLLDPTGVFGEGQGILIKDDRIIPKGIETAASGYVTSPRSYTDKEYVDALALGIVTSWKAPVKVSTTAAGTLATSFENGDTVDGVALVTGDRILIKDQATQSENGIYTVNASGAPTRASDANVAAELEGAAVTVQQGTSNANTTWTQTTDGITLGSSNIVWAQLGSSQPDASASVKGIAKLYPDVAAQNTDGAPDQNAVFDALALKANLTDVIGVQDLFFPAGAMRPRITNGCSAVTPVEFATSLVNLYVLAFDQTTQEFAQFDIVPPRKWNNGTITATPVWTSQSGTGTVQWGVSFGSYRNDDALTVALGTPQTSDDTLLATNDFHSGPDTSAITPAGTVQDGNLLVAQISRNPASDTLNADALLIGLWLHFTTNAAIDA